MKITPGVTWASGDTVNHTQLNAFLTNAVITSGTLDQVALGENALDSLTSGTDNVGIGDNAGTAITDGHSNTIVGNEALKTADSAYNNVAIGENAMGLGAGTLAQNVAIGAGALIDLAGDIGSSESFSNVAIGNSAGADITTGKTNVFIGASCGSQLTTDSSLNVLLGDGAMGFAAAAVDGAIAVGYQALKVNTADLNTGVGYKAGLANTSGDDNTYVGSQAGYTNITGTDNTFIGDNAGYYVTANQNTALGSDANTTSGSPAAYANTTCLGYAVDPTASNQVRLGNASVSSLHCQVSLTVDSDKRIKKNVKSSKIGLDFINALRSVEYKKKNPFSWPDELKEQRFKKEKPDKKPEDDPVTYNGFIAQEVKEVMDKQGITDWDGWRQSDNTMQSLTATALIGPLVKAIQELSSKVAKLEAKT